LKVTSGTWVIIIYSDLSYCVFIFKMLPLYNKGYGYL